ncbi:membrane protein [Mycolicibacterium doricum]|uniref:Membrane protein n=1 Tax=Mycolicibacterium doricum TaxID=126673 RepID=A0A7I7VZK1_9MYCO|nr:DUF3159 domain-containing protein [Mycolicibacterium doricum]MCV7269713.1 DUF3159 domain-containing protein [Mycolicibacterium doricum]BBZ09563.1 membrane protein [Mycolicibacterium doricum]
MQLDRSRAQHLFSRFGGVPGLIYSTVPIAAFAVADTYLTLLPALGLALTAAGLVLLWRLLRGDSYQPALAGFLGVVVGATLSLFTGQSRDYFVIHIWTALLLALVFTASILLRRPAVGLLWAWAHGHATSWRRNTKVMLSFDIATMIWVLVFTTRFLVQQHFYNADETAWLAITRIAMGWPLTGLAGAATFLAIRIAERNHATE